MTGGRPCDGTAPQEEFDNLSESLREWLGPPAPHRKPQAPALDGDGGGSDVEGNDGGNGGGEGDQQCHLPRLLGEELKVNVPLVPPIPEAH